jgi:heme-degrading monooxygenase HmoA
VTTRAGQPYTAGSWLVCAGREDEFVAAWTEFTAWSLQHTPGAESFVLIRHASDPLRFLSFGAWTDADAVASWRGSDEFRERLGRCRALCEEFEGHDYTAAASQEKMQT